MSWKNKFMTPSRIDGYLYHRSSEQSVDEYIRQLLRLDPIGAKADAGTALHKYVETFRYGIALPEQFESDDWKFTNTIKNDLIIDYPILREISHARKFNDDVTIYGKIDAVGAYKIHDLKTTSRMDMEKYMTSMQWKLYLWMTSYHIFTYNIFLVDVIENTKEVFLLNYEEITLTKYATMADEIRSILNDYSNYLDILKDMIFATAAIHNIDLFKPRRQLS